MALATLLIANQLLYAQVPLSDPRLDSFVADLRDRSNSRHYRLASRQSAIHKWLIRDCMQELGFSDAVNTESQEWQEALYGQYAYCQDHHILGIDPPCPSVDIVEESVNSACYQVSYGKIDWSHEIMHPVRKNLLSEWELDSASLDVKSIELAWSSCMARDGHSYESRFDMFSSFARAYADAADIEPDAATESKILESVEQCFASTHYYQSRKEIANSLIEKYIIQQRELIEALLVRYESAELVAERMIEKYCDEDRSAIVEMYEQDNLTSTSICE